MEIKMKNSIVKNSQIKLFALTLFLITFLVQTKVVAQSLEVKNNSQLESKADTNLNNEQTVRDRFWLFAVPANSDYPHIKRRSVMTPAEGTCYLDIPNIIMVQAGKDNGEQAYGKFESPLSQYMVALRPLKRVVWSVVGSAGFYSPEETREILKIAETSSNFYGIMLDDFFTGNKEGQRAKLSIEEFTDIHKQLKQINKNYKVLATVYNDQLDLPLDDYFKMIDVVTFWTMNFDDLENMGSNMKKMKSVAPHAKIMLGCYFIDYGKNKGVPVPLMKKQCETGLRWIREGKIDGMIFLANTTMDIGLESVEWTRNWIKEVGDTPIPGKHSFDDHGGF